MKRHMLTFTLAGLLALGLVSCAWTENWGTTNPPVARLKVFDYTETTDVGIGTDIYFSVTNVTDQELRDLTLTVTANPSYDVDLPFEEMTIDRIAPNAVWTPRTPFVVTSQHSGEITIFFTLTEDGKFLSRDYAIIQVGPEFDHDRDDFFMMR